MKTKELKGLLLGEAVNKLHDDKLKLSIEEALNDGTKPWFLSKTLWLNIAALVALLIQSEHGFVIPPEEQLIIVGFANIILRAITGKELHL